MIDDISKSLFNIDPIDRALYYRDLHKGLCFVTQQKVFLTLLYFENFACMSLHNKIIINIYIYIGLCHL